MTIVIRYKFPGRGGPLFSYIRDNILLRVLRARKSSVFMIFAVLEYNRTLAVPKYVSRVFRRRRPVEFFFFIFLHRLK